MKWIRVDTDAPNDLKIQLLLRRGAMLAPNGAQAWAGAVWLLWCHVGAKGKGPPGLGVRADGSPLDPLEMAVACYFAGVVELEAFLAACAEVRLIDPTRWATDHVVFLPAMASRADEYTKKRARKAARKKNGTGPEDPGGAPDTSRPVSGHYPQNEAAPVCTVGSVDLDQVTGSTTRSPLHDTGLALEGVGQVERLVEVWNLTAGPTLPKVERINATRRKAYSKALAEHPNLAEWSAVIAHLNGSAWWLGKERPATGNGSAWIGHLDYLAKAGKFQVALERMRAATARQAARPGASSSGGGYGVDAGRGRTTRPPGTFAAAAAEGGGDVH
jgi:hypothetical protein